MKFYDTENDMWYVDVIESDYFMGQKIDHKRSFDSLDEANAFVQEFNAVNDKPYTPKWYMYASAPYQIQHQPV